MNTPQNSNKTAIIVITREKRKNAPKTELKINEKRSNKTENKQQNCELNYSDTSEIKNERNEKRRGIAVKMESGGVVFVDLTIIEKEKWKGGDTAGGWCFRGERKERERVERERGEMGLLRTKRRGRKGVGVLAIRRRRLGKVCGWNR